MQIDVQKVIDDLLEQNKNLTLQLSIARVTINELQSAIQTMSEAIPQTQAESENQQQ